MKIETVDCNEIRGRLVVLTTEQVDAKGQNKIIKDRIKALTGAAFEPTNLVESDIVAFYICQDGQTFRAIDDDEFSGFVMGSTASVAEKVYFMWNVGFVTADCGTAFSVIATHNAAERLMRDKGLKLYKGKLMSDEEIDDILGKKVYDAWAANHADEDVEPWENLREMDKKCWIAFSKTMQFNDEIDY